MMSIANMVRYSIKAKPLSYVAMRVFKQRYLSPAHQPVAGNGLNNTTSDYAEILQQVNSCKGGGKDGLQRLENILNLAPTHRMPSVVMRAIIRVYLEAAQPRIALNHLLLSMERGYRPLLEDFECLIYGLLRYSDEHSALELFNNLSNNSLRPRTATFNLFIDFYLREEQPDKARQMFRALEEAGLHANQTTYLNFIRFFISKADFAASDRIRQYMKTKRISVDIRFYNGLLDLMLRRQETGQIDILMNEMKELRIKPDAKTFEILLQSYCQKQGHEGIETIFTTMDKVGIKPSVKTFNKLLESLSHVQTPERTKELLLEMNNLKLKFNRHTYAALISNLLHNNRPVEAIEMIQHLGTNGIPLAIESYGKLLELCMEKRFDMGIKALWIQMQKHNMNPNSRVINIILRHYLMKRRYHQVDNLFLKMNREWNLKPNAFIVGSLLNHYVENLDIIKVKEILKLLKQQNLPISSILYNILMKTFYSYSRYQMGGYIGRLDLYEKLGNSDNSHPSWGATINSLPVNLSLLQNHFENIFGLPFRPSVHIYNEILLALLMRFRFEHMNSFVQEMRRKNIAFNLTTFTFLIKARVFSDEMAGARATLKDMVRNGLKPTILQCALVFHAYCRKLMVEEAEAFLKEIELCYNIRPNHVFFGSLIYAYSRRMEYPQVFRIFEAMEQCGMRPDTETCNYILFALFDMNEFAEAKKFFEKMILQGIPRNGHTYSYLILGYLSRGKEDVNFLNLLADGIMPGNVLDTIPFNRLLRYQMNNRHQDAVISCLLMMCDYCVRFDEDTIQFIAWAVEHYLSNPEKLTQLAKIFCKALIDYPDHIVKHWYEPLKEALDADLFEEESQHLVYVYDHRDELRQLWTLVKFETMERLNERFSPLEAWQEPDDIISLEKDLSSSSEVAKSQDILCGITGTIENTLTDSSVPNQMILSQ